MKVKKPSEFESGHPDNKTRTQCGFYNDQFGALGALDNFEESCLKLGVENPNQKTNLEMISKIEMKQSGARWHVEYRELIPETGKYARRRVYGDVNREKDLDKRKVLLNDLYQEILTGICTRITNLKTGESEIKKYILAYLSDKQSSLSRSSIKNMSLALKYFYKFLLQNNYHLTPIHGIRKNHIHEFRVYLTRITGNRSVNNHISFVSSFFQYYIDNFDDVLFKNPVKGLHKLPTSSETHVAYTDQQKRDYFEYMRVNDPILLLYCKFIGLGFTRCEETRHIRVADIDFDRKTITLWAGKAKTGKRINKPMLNVFNNMLIDAGIHKAPASHFVFSRTGGPGEKQCGKNYFRKRFKILKDKFLLTKKYSIYGFRHTTASEMIDNNAPWREVMKYTGHTTMASFEAYTKSLKNKPAKDLSEYIRIT